MSYADARRIDRDLIPVVDIGPLRDGSNPAEVATALHRASQEIGFIYVANHGIDETVLEDARKIEDNVREMFERSQSMLPAPEGYDVSQSGDDPMVN